MPFFSFHTLNHLTAEMYPIDRVKMARHIYEMVSSLRKTGLLLQVSHMTIARWVKNPVRKQYDSHRRTRKRNVVSEFIRAAVINDPFLSNFKLRTIVRETFGFNVSKELVRTVIRRHGFRNVHLLYVPPYSPWFNPVEGVFSIVKRNYYSTRDIQQSFQCVKDIHIRSFVRR